MESRDGIVMEEKYYNALVRGFAPTHPFNRAPQASLTTPPHTLPHLPHAPFRSRCD